MKPLGLVLTQSDWFPYQKRKFGHRQVQRQDNVKTQGEDDHLQAKEKHLVQI